MTSAADNFDVGDGQLAAELMPGRRSAPCQRSLVDRGIPAGEPG
jgi:hypothetical protein